MKVAYNESKMVENVLVEKALQASTEKKNPKMLVSEFVEQNLAKHEIQDLDTRMKEIEKTIIIIRTDVKSSINNRMYNTWLNRITNIAGRWKKLYSDTNNELYNHLYKVSQIQQNAWESIIRDIGWIERNVFTEVDDISTMVEGFEEGDLENLFSNEQHTSGPNEQHINELKRARNAEETPGTEKKRKTEPYQSESTKAPKETSKEVISAKNANEDLVDISSEDEETIINDAMHEAERDEVGHINMNDFGNMIEKYIN